MKMRGPLRVLVTLCVLGMALAVFKPPEVNIYTEKPIEHEDNSLVCLVQGFHPPSIHVKLLKDGEELKTKKCNDMTFKQDWTYRSLCYNKMKIDPNSVYECSVEHNGNPAKIFRLENII